MAKALNAEVLTLVRLGNARRELAQCVDLQDLKRIRDQAAALQAYTKAQGLSADLQTKAGSIRVDAEARIGELERERVPDKGWPGKGKPVSRGTGFSPVERRRFRALARIPEAEREAIKATLAEDVTPTGVLKAGLQRKRASEDSKKQQERAAIARKAPSGLVVIGDFREKLKELPDSCASLILTDPPYDRKSAHLYADVAREGARILMPGGSLIVYCGQYLLGEILPTMIQHLRIWWVLALHHDRGPHARMREYGIVVHWKPMLWLVKESRADKHTYIDDLVSSPQREKDYHDWQQGEAPAAYLIDKLTRPGDLVVDPMCGGGTTAVAAVKAGRRFWTCEIDSTSAGIAARRIESVRSGLP